MKLSTALSVFALSCLAIDAYAQGTPDCQWTDVYASATVGASRANTSSGTPCVAFRLTYDAIAMAAVSIEIDAAPWNAAGTGPGTFTLVSSTYVVIGTNPLTSPTSGTLILSDGWYQPFLRTNVTTFTPTGATGTVTARLYGYKGTSAAGSGTTPIGPAGGGLSGSYPNPSLVAADGNTSVQFNFAGAFAGDSANFAWFETSIATPAAPTVTQHGTAGLVSYAYKIAWLTLAGNGLASVATTTTTGNATLSASNYNIITPPACPATASGYLVQRTIDPNSHTGTLPIIGTCGSPMDDTYGATYGALNLYPQGTAPADGSTGLYSDFIRAPSAIFGTNPFTLSMGINGNTARAPISSFSTEDTAIELYDENATFAIGVYGAATATGTGGDAIGLFFGANYSGPGDSGGGLVAVEAGMTVLGAGNVTGWSDEYSFVTSPYSSSGRFANLAGFDCTAGSFTTTSAATTSNACFHSLQTPVGGSTVYFLFEEGGIPSKLAGSIELDSTVTIPTIKATSGQRYVCITTTGQLTSSAAACVGT